METGHIQILPSYSLMFAHLLTAAACMVIMVIIIVVRPKICTHIHIQYILRLYAIQISNISFFSLSRSPISHYITLPKTILCFCILFRCVILQWQYFTATSMQSHFNFLLHFLCAGFFLLFFLLLHSFFLSGLFKFFFSSPQL